MIVLDSSAIIAMIQDEPEASRFFDIISAAEACAVSAVTVFEASLVLHRRRGATGAEDVAGFIAVSRAAIHPFDAAMIPVALDAHRRFGKGARARASLNFGDCISYALAKSLDAPLLYKGDDFPHTDIASCL